MGIMLGRKPANGYHPSIVYFLFQDCVKMKQTLRAHFYSLFQACAKMKSNLSTVLFFVSNSCKNETDPDHSSLFVSISLKYEVDNQAYFCHFLMLVKNL
jgi:hypothetical protein